MSNVREFYLNKSFWGEQWNSEVSKKMDRIKDLPLDEFIKRVCDLRSLKYCVCKGLVKCKTVLGERLHPSD
jgi:hypothetical protein